MLKRKFTSKAFLLPYSPYFLFTLMETPLFLPSPLRRLSPMPSLCSFSIFFPAFRMDLAQTSAVAKFLCLLHVTNTYICSTTLVFAPSPSFFSSSSSFIWVLIIIGFQVYGPSMLPTLNLSGDVLLVEQLSHRLGKVCPGDVVHRCGIFFNFMSVVV